MLVRSIPVSIFIGYLFVDQAITAPTTALNAITIAAFRKYVLVSLIQNGQVCNQSPEPSLLIQFMMEFTIHIQCVAVLVI